jgi:WD40 repeat protein
VTAPETRPAPAEPFVGPQAFQLEDDWRFFGRDREVADLTDIVTASRVVLLYSPSGAGKSSLLNAALIPRFAEQFCVLPVILVGGAPAPMPDGRPVNRYIRSALLSIESALPESERMPADELAASDFVTYLERRRAANGDDRPELLIFDQFEEILSIDPYDREEKTAFFEQVGEALRDRHRWAIFSMREEYDARLDPYRRLVPTGLATRFRLDLLGTDAATTAVWRPTVDLPVKITVEAAERIVADLSQVQTEQDGEVVTRQVAHVDPVQLQVVCLRLWHRRAPDATEITADDIERTGTNVDVALGEYYDEAVAAAADATSVAERTIRAWIGDHLITRNGVRNRVLREAGESRGLDDRVIDALLGKYLLRTVPGDATWVELAHDRLVPPVRQSNDAWFVANLSPLQRHAGAWDQSRRSRDMVLQGALLKEAGAWAKEHPEQVTDVERDFLAASAAARDASLKRWAIWAVAALTVIAIMALSLTAWALSEERRADDARATAETQADVSRTQALAAQAPDQHDAGDDERGALLARQAYLSDVALDGQMLGLVDASLRTVLTQSHFSVVLDHDDVVIAATFNADASTLTTVTGPLNVTGGTENRPITVWRWNTSAVGVETQRVEGTASSLTAVVIDPEGVRLAVGTVEGDVLIWDLSRSGDEPIILRESRSAVGALAFSADGHRLAAGYADGMVQIRDANDPGGDPYTLPTGETAVTGVAFNPDGTILATGRADGTVEMWDIEGGGITPRIIRGHSGAVRTLAFSPDSLLLATASSDATARLWEVPSGEAHGAPMPSGGALAFSHDGATLAVARDDRTVALVDPADSGAEPEILFGHGDAIRAIALSSDGRALATGSADGTARIWNLGSAGAEPIALDSVGQNGDVASAVTVSGGDSLRVARAGADGVVRQWIYRGSGPEGAGDVQSRPGWVTAIAVSHDGAILVVGGRDGSVQLWTPEGETVAGPSASRMTREVVTALALDADGSTLAIGTANGTIRVWSSTGSGLDIELRGPRVAITALGFSNDGRLFSGDAGGTIRSWNPAQADAGSQVLLDTDTGVTALALDRGAETFAVADAAGTVRLVRVAQPGADPVVLRAEATGPVTALAFSSDGTALYTVHADGTVRSWIARTDVLAEMVCQTVRRNLTMEEWVRFIGSQVEYERTCGNLPPGEGAPGAGMIAASPVTFAEPSGPPDPASGGDA